MKNTSARPAERMETIMQTYGNMLFRLCLITLGNASDAEELVVEVTMLRAGEAPYSFFELFGINTYEIRDNQNNVILKGTASEMVGITDGKACISLPVNSLLSGDYKLLVTELVGSSKADQPLVVSGTWECSFTK